MPGFDPEIPAVAVIADAHFHDIEGNYDVDGVMVGGRRLTVRSWADTARSTRVFNESFAALPAALEDVCSRGIRHVVLLGDYTDDGQRTTTESVARLLRHWRDRHNMSFYAIPGNHDVFGPLGKHQSTRFLDASGTTTLVTSDAEIAALEAQLVQARQERSERPPRAEAGRPHFDGPRGDHRPGGPRPPPRKEEGKKRKGGWGGGGKKNKKKN